MEGGEGQERAESEAGAAKRPVKLFVTITRWSLLCPSSANGHVPTTTDTMWIIKLVA